MKTLETSDFNLAACLVTSGIEVERFRKEGRRTVWEFQWSPEADDIQRGFINGDLQLPANKLFYTIKLLKNQIYS